MIKKTLPSNINSLQICNEYHINNSSFYFRSLWHLCDGSTLALSFAYIIFLINDGSLKLIHCPSQYHQHVSNILMFNKLTNILKFKKLTNILKFNKLTNIMKFNKLQSFQKWLMHKVLGTLGRVMNIHRTNHYHLPQNPRAHRPRPQNDTQHTPLTNPFDHRT